MCGAVFKGNGGGVNEFNSSRNIDKKFIDIVIVCSKIGLCHAAFWVWPEALEMPGEAIWRLWNAKSSASETAGGAHSAPPDLVTDEDEACCPSSRTPPSSRPFRPCLSSPNFQTPPEVKFHIRSRTVWTVGLLRLLYCVALRPASTHHTSQCVWCFRSSQHSLLDVVIVIVSTRRHVSRHCSISFALKWSLSPWLSLHCSR